MTSLTDNAEAHASFEALLNSPNLPARAEYILAIESDDTDIKRAHLLRCMNIAVDGTDCLESVIITHRPDGATSTLASAGLFCFIGALPDTTWLPNIATDKAGFIRTDSQLDHDLGPRWDTLRRRPLPFETSVPGVFAAGDVRLGSMKRVAAAMGEGAAAVASVHAKLALPDAG